MVNNERGELKKHINKSFGYEFVILNLKMVNNDSSGWVCFFEFLHWKWWTMIAQDQCVFVSFCTVVTNDSTIGISCCRCLVFTKEFFIFIFLKKCLSIVNCLLSLGAIVTTSILLFAEDFGRIIGNWKLHLGMLTTSKTF